MPRKRSKSGASGSSSENHSSARQCAICIGISSVKM